MNLKKHGPTILSIVVAVAVAAGATKLALMILGPLLYLLVLLLLFVVHVGVVKSIEAKRALRGYKMPYFFQLPRMPIIEKIVDIAKQNYESIFTPNGNEGEE